MKDRLLIQALTSLPWALDLMVLQNLAAVIQRHAVGESIDAEAIAAIVADRDARTEHRAQSTNSSAGGDGWQLVGSVAVIPVSGVIARRASQVNNASQPRGTSVDQIQGALRQARADSRVASILLRVDSPGGSVDGIKTLAAEIRGLRGQTGGAMNAKPVWATIEGMGASAAYWIAAQSSRVNIEPDAHAGSIGVYSAIVDSSAKAEKDGLKVHLISSGGVKGSGMPGVPVSTDAIAHYQSLVDTHYANFLGDVAAGRGITMDQARTLGDGRVWVGPDAKAAGLADTVSTTENVIAEMQRMYGGKAEGSRQLAVGSGEGTEHRSQSTEHDHAGRVIVAQDQTNATGAAATGMVPVADVAAQGSTDMRTIHLLSAAMGIAGMNFNPNNETGGGGGASAATPAAATPTPTTPTIAPNAVLQSAGTPNNGGGVNPAAIAAAMAILNMAGQQAPAAQAPTLNLVHPPAASADQVAEANMARVNGIRAMARGYGDVDGMAALVDAAVGDTRVSADEFSRRATALVTRAQAPVGATPTVSGGPTQWEKERGAILVSLLGRVRPELIRGGTNDAEVQGLERAARAAGFASLAAFQSAHNTAQANGVGRMRLIDVVEASANRRINGRRWSNEGDLMEAAFGSNTGDLPAIFRDFNNRTLLSYFAEAPTSWQQWCGVVSANDFRTQEFVSLSESADLNEVQPNGDLDEATPSDRSETMKLKTHGRKISITRQMVINDDLGGIQRWMQNNGYAAARKPEQLAIGILTANAALSDGKALFHADHRNLAGSGTALSASTAEAAITAMLSQKGFGENAAPLFIMPRILLVPAALWATAYRICNNPTDPTAATANSNVLNPIKGMLTPVWTPYLDATSTTGWYLIADKSTPLVVLSFLNGNQSPILTQVGNGSIRGIEYEMLYDVNAKAVQFEAGYKNAGG